MPSLPSVYHAPARRGLSLAPARPPRLPHGPVRFKRCDILGRGVKAAITLEDGEVTIWLTSRTVDGLRVGSRDSWLTILHELAHALFDLPAVADPSTVSAETRLRIEARAEVFALFMLESMGAALEFAHTEAEDAQ